MSQPTHKWEAFPIQLAAWRNERDGKVWHAFKLSKRYKTDEGEWKSTDNLSERDLPIAASLLNRAHMELGITKGD